MSIERRLLRHRYIDENGCWNCMASPYPNGYGRVTVNYITHLSHRLAAHVWLGFDLDSDLLVLHKCDNRRCFNPEHLWFGDKKDNAIDSLSKGKAGNQYVKGIYKVLQ